jgi:hypothetical protein
MRVARCKLSPASNETDEEGEMEDEERRGEKEKGDAQV